MYKVVLLYMQLQICAFLNLVKLCILVHLVIQPAQSCVLCCITVFFAHFIDIQRCTLERGHPQLEPSPPLRHCPRLLSLYWCSCAQPGFLTLICISKCLGAPSSSRLHFKSLLRGTCRAAPLTADDSIRAWTRTHTGGGGWRGGYLLL